MEGRVRAPAQGPFCDDPATNSKSRALGIKNNENENHISETSNINQFLDVFVIDLSFLLCFTS